MVIWPELLRFCEDACALFLKIRIVEISDFVKLLSRLSEA
jgi:hypothetical protein